MIRILTTICLGTIPLVSISCGVDSSPDTSDLSWLEWVSQEDRDPSNDFSVVLVEKDDNQSLPYCSGTLISEDLVATAAHCVPSDLGYESISVVRNNSRSNKKSGAIAAYGAIDGGESNDESIYHVKDLTILKLENPSAFAGVSNATVASEDWLNSFIEESQDGSNDSIYEIEMHGFGHKKVGENFPNGKRRVAHVKPSEVRFLEDSTTARSLVIESKSDYRITACGGDSGGGVFVKKKDDPNSPVVIIGVTSRLTIPVILGFNSCGTTQGNTTIATALYQEAPDYVAATGGNTPGPVELTPEEARDYVLQKLLEKEVINEPEMLSLQKIDFCPVFEGTESLKGFWRCAESDLDDIIAKYQAEDMVLDKDEEEWLPSWSHSGQFKPLKYWSGFRRIPMGFYRKASNADRRRLSNVVVNDIENLSELKIRMKS